MFGAPENRYPHGKGNNHTNGPFVFQGTLIHTTPAKPAFFGIDHQWRPFIIRVGCKHVHGTNIHTAIACAANGGIDFYCPERAVNPVRV
jgi:hypothetical protein